MPRNPHVTKRDDPRFDRRLLSILPDHAHDTIGESAAKQIVDVIAVLNSASDDGRLVEIWGCGDGYSEDSAYALAARALSSLPPGKARRRVFRRLYNELIKKADDS